MTHILSHTSAHQWAVSFVSTSYYTARVVSNYRCGRPQGVEGKPQADKSGQGGGKRIFVDVPYGRPQMGKVNPRLS